MSAVAATTLVNALAISRAAGYPDPAAVPPGYLLDAIGQGAIDNTNTVPGQLIDFTDESTWSLDPLWQEEFGPSMDVSIGFHGVMVELVTVSNYTHFTPAAWRAATEGLTLQAWAGGKKVVRPVRVVLAGATTVYEKADADTAAYLNHTRYEQPLRDFLPFHANLKSNKGAGIYATAACSALLSAIATDVRVYVDGVVYSNAVAGGSMADQISKACQSTPIAALQAWRERADEKARGPIMVQSAI